MKKARTSLRCHTCHNSNVAIYYDRYAEAHQRVKCPRCGTSRALSAHDQAHITTKG